MRKSLCKGWKVWKDTLVHLPWKWNCSHAADFKHLGKEDGNLKQKSDSVPSRCVAFSFWCRVFDWLDNDGGSSWAVVHFLKARRLEGVTRFCFFIAVGWLNLVWDPYSKFAVIPCRSPRKVWFFFNLAQYLLTLLIPFQLESSFCYLPKVKQTLKLMNALIALVPIFRLDPPVDFVDQYYVRSS